MKIVERIDYGAPEVLRERETATPDRGINKDNRISRRDPIVFVLIGSQPPRRPTASASPQ